MHVDFWITPLQIDLMVWLAVLVPLVIYLIIGAEIVEQTKDDLKIGCGIIIVWIFWLPIIIIATITKDNE